MEKKQVFVFTSGDQIEAWEDYFQNNNDPSLAPFLPYLERVSIEISNSYQELVKVLENKSLPLLIALDLLDQHEITNEIKKLKVKELGLNPRNLSIVSVSNRQQYGDKGLIAEFSEAGTEDPYFLFLKALVRATCFSEEIPVEGENPISPHFLDTQKMELVLLKGATDKMIVKLDRSHCEILEILLCFRNKEVPKKTLSGGESEGSLRASISRMKKILYSEEIASFFGISATDKKKRIHEIEKKLGFRIVTLREIGYTLEITSNQT